MGSFSRAVKVFPGSLDSDHCNIRGEGHGQLAAQTHKE